MNRSWETLLFLSAMPHIFNFPEFSALLSSEDSFFLHRTKYFKSLFDLLKVDEDSSNGCTITTIHFFCNEPISSSREGGGDHQIPWVHPTAIISFVCVTSCKFHWICSSLWSIQTWYLATFYGVGGESSGSRVGLASGTPSSYHAPIAKFNFSKSISTQKRWWICVKTTFWVIWAIKNIDIWRDNMKHYKYLGSAV